ncbi:hypothetical protein N7509_001361 [Penicillium cosmopolitanum]|uniref:Zn(2)-C6 fungal-type domain-containing protein n=1 Tax=Penicillium cosmopolitanum TaxID=1131564 RepID=A0A9W9WCM3_9EURO|nr:uncharacterized protein N7509_001361 [Penicillium cosmopolitanum]KAJ5414734.1 hypothetical protein N7509_001361 [Penicillium cosmopolitanum]
MPGVPSSKGCDACRKIKKKCDELQPCSRCRRLQINCIGSGKQRFKFKHADSKSATGHTALGKRRAVVPSARSAASFRIAMQVPENELASSLIGTLNITDIRYALEYYGYFLKDIPRRLGSSSALDAAVKALVTAYPYFHDRDFPPEALMYYGRSLRSLRDTLDDPTEARSVNTLCAVYLITICQSWLGKYDDQLASHGEAIAHLLKMSDFTQIKSNFERDIIITLTVPVIIEAIVNPRIKMEPKFFQLVSNLNDSAPVSPARNEIPRSSTKLPTIAKFPEWIRNLTPGDLPDIAAAYLRIRNDSQRMREYLDNWPATGFTVTSSFLVMQRSRYQAGYATLITLGLMLNTLLRVFHPGNPVLSAEAAFFCDEIVLEAELASCYRPLGAAYIALCLVVAWAAAEDIHQLDRIDSILADYQSDFKEISWKDRAIWLRKQFGRYLNMAGTETTDLGPLDGSRKLAANISDSSSSPETCCVM